jgi:methionine-rich copper-binding protein CopC
MNLRILLLAPGLLFCGLGSASAHALLRTASPAVGSTVTTPPATVSITFSEGVEPQFSTIEVRDEAGARVDKADPHNGPGGQTRLLVDLQPLKPGRYAVSWSAISVDTHHTEGKFNFTVAAP